MNHQKGKIFIISGPSGVGKGTVIKIAKSYLNNFGQIKTITTREKRKGKTKEKDRIFTTKNKFKDMIKRGEVVEYNFYNNEYYGTPKKELEHLINNNKNILLEIDVNGAKRVKRKYPEDVILIFIWTDLEKIERRLRQRGQNTETEIQERLNRAQKELLEKKFYNYNIENIEGRPKQAGMKLVKICNSNIK